MIHFLSTSCDVFVFHCCNEFTNFEHKLCAVGNSRTWECDLETFMLLLLDLEGIDPFVLMYDGYGTVVEYFSRALGGVW